jgi:PAS domain S-box-containing protein
MFISPRFKALLGYSEQEFPNRADSIMGAMHTDDRPQVMRALREHLSQDRPFAVECRLRNRQGEWVWFAIGGLAQRDGKGRAFRMAGSLVDVTERKRAEMVLQEANRAKDEFLATLAHELRNPLAPLRTGVEILKRSGTGDAATQRTLDTMQRQLTHMVRLIDDLLDISRITSGKIRLNMERISLVQAVETALELSRPGMQAARHALAVALPEHDIQLQGDMTRIAQAVGNLLNNAAKYTPPGGHVGLRVWQEGEEAFVEVKDDGIGVPPEMLESIFSLFTQVGRSVEQAHGGLGIGLYLVRRLVALHGGSVVARSAGPGQGSTFTVRLPCLPQAPAATSAPAGAPAAAPAPMKVLVVDDNVDAAETLASLLELLGLQTRCVHDGPGVRDAALEFVPDLVLLDIGLPGMSGYEVARQLRAHPLLARTTLVALTGWGAESDRQRARDAGFDHHLTKPVALPELEKLLQPQGSTPA